MKVPLMAFFAACTLILLAHPSAVGQATIIVPANVEWTNTSIYIEQGDHIRINARGEWNYDPRPQFRTGPDGLDVGFRMPLGMLTGKIGDGEVFLIGSEWEGAPEKGGWLLLGMYDTTRYDNNVGELTVSIEVRHANSESEAEVNDSGSAEEGEQDEDNTLVDEIEVLNGLDEDGMCKLGLAGILMLLAFLYVIVGRKGKGVKRKKKGKKRKRKKQ